MEQKLKGTIIQGIKVERVPIEARTEFIYLTPKLAQVLLNNNEHNRDISKHNQAFITQGITDEDFVITHQGVCVSDKGNIIDGQHRCEAVIESGKSIPILYVEGIPEGSIHYLDQGKVRSMADSFKIEKIPEHGIKSIISRRIYQYKYDNRNPNVKHKENRNQVLKFFAENKEHLENAVSFVKSRRELKVLLIPITTLIVLKFLTNEIDPEKSDMFIKYCMNPEKHPSTPVYAAYKFISKLRNKSLYSPSIQNHTMEVLSLAWNDFRDDERIEKYDIDNSVCRPFPELK